MKRLSALSALLLLGALLPTTFTGAARADALQDDIATLQHGWAAAYYHAPGDAQEQMFESLVRNAEQITTRHGGQAAPLVWQAIILSSAAKVQGGLSALRSVKQARELLLAAEKIDATALEGSVYTSLGSLYAKVPGWPVGFGDKKRAREYLDKALALNPDGIDPNFFYGELLLDQGDKAGAAIYLQKALAAPPRAGREDADVGRRGEIEALLAKVQTS